MVIHTVRVRRELISLVYSASVEGIKSELKWELH